MNITVNITDIYCTACTKNSIEKNETITSSSTSLELQNGFIFNVLSVNDNSFSIIIQNGQKVIIRNILFDVETSILLPTRCTHIVTIVGTNNN